MRLFSARAALLGTAAAMGICLDPASAAAKSHHPAATLPATAQTAAQTNAEANQTAVAPQATTAANEGQDTATGVIFVTARRTEEKLQRVPASISAFNERALDRLQATDTTGLQGAVPNLNIVQGRGSSNATNIFIRGIGQPDALQTFDPAVGVYVDDVYLSRIRGNQLDLLDVDRIEVLRGPQGTLYGKNTIGGAIKYITHKPGKVLRINETFAVGNYGQIESKASVSGPLSQGVSAGVAVMYSGHNGYVKDAVLDQRYNDKNSFGARGQLAFTPSANIRIDLSADYSRDDDALNVGRPLNNLTTAFGAVLPVTDIDSSGPYHWIGRTTPGLPNSTKMKHYGFAGTAAFDIGNGLTLKSITAYRNLKTRDYVDIDATQYNTGDVLVAVHQNQLSQEFQATYSSDRFSGVAGLYYLREHVPSHQESFGSDFLRPFTFLRTIDDNLLTKSYAAYVNGSYTVLPDVRLSAGIRYTKETKDYQRSTTIFTNLPGFSSTFPYAPHDHWNDWSPMASVDWQVTPSTMLYARVAKGFKSGGFNGRANSPGEATEYKPETVWSYEAGFKTSIANQLRVTGAVFDNDYRNYQARIQTSATDPNSPINLALLSVVNAGKLRIRGAELEAYWSPTKELLIDGQLGYLDSQYKEFFDNRFPNHSRAFQTPPFSPKWTLRLGAQYAFDMGNSGSLTLGGQTRYRSRQSLAIDNTFINGLIGTTIEVPGLFQNSYWLEDARIVWESPSKKVAAGIYVNNLTKKAYKTDAQEFSSVGSIRTVYYGSPRTVTARVTVRY
ncbi:MAG: TonB-dependent receptor [Sphingomicrobium sp.]